MSYKPIKKGPLLIPSGSNRNPDGLHLHIILTDACANCQHLLVSISTVRVGQYHDPTCIVKPENMILYVIRALLFTGELPHFVLTI